MEIFFLLLIFVHLSNSAFKVPFGNNFFNKFLDSIDENN